MKPVRLAAELDISPKTLRAWLRQTFPRHEGEKNSTWEMTAAQVAAARQKWGGTERAELPTRSSPAGPPTNVTPARDADPPARATSADTDVGSLLATLLDAASPISPTTVYSDQPGIYGVFFLGGEFPLREAGVTSGTLVYIGKTESNQRTRDLKQHLADGKTGHSTLRRTVAALLRTDLGLHPRPRSDTEKTDRRFTHFRLDETGERNLTTWMRANLGLAFLPRGGPIAEIRRTENELIRAAVPVLNLAGNSANPHLERIKAARAECVALAKQRNQKGRESLI